MVQFAYSPSPQPSPSRGEGANIPSPWRRVMHINLSGGQRTIFPSPTPSPRGSGALFFPSPLEGEGGRRPGEGATDPRRGLARFTISCSRARPRSSGKTRAGPKRPGRGWGGLPAWEGGHPGRHAGWKPALLQEERDALHSSVICSNDTICITRPGGEGEGGGRRYAGRGQERCETEPLPENSLRSAR